LRPDFQFRPKSVLGLQPLALSVSCSSGVAGWTSSKKRRELPDKLDHFPGRIIADLNNAKGLLQ
jgi:hypothetical protein